MLSNSANIFSNANEFREFLQNANFSNSSRITELSLELQNNTNNYIKNLAHLTQEEILDMITVEINRQFDNNLEIQSSLSNKGDICGDNYKRARSRCARNYAIGSAAVILSTFFTIGIGTAIGTAAVITSGALCYNDASNDYMSCQK